MRSLVPRYLSSLGLSRLSNDELHAVVAAVEKAAPESELVQSDPATQAAVLAVDQRGAALAGASVNVADARTALRLAIAVEAERRSELQGEIRSYVILITNRAKSPADVGNAGLPPAPPRPPRNQVPDVPEQIDVKPPRRGRGKTVVSVHETGARRGQYVAEQSADGLIWKPLGVERGKTRTLVGETGEKVWVRFAAVRGRFQSGWSIAVLVSIP